MGVIERGKLLVRETPHPIEFGEIDALLAPSRQLDPCVEPSDGFFRAACRDQQLAEGRMNMALANASASSGESVERLEGGVQSRLQLALGRVAQTDQELPEGKPHPETLVLRQRNRAQSVFADAGPEPAVKQHQ